MFNNQMGFNQGGMQMGQSALPFRYDVTTSLPITGAPDNPSTYPSFNVFPPMQQYYRSIVGFCIHELQSNVGKNHLRVFAFNAMSSNNWNNQFFSGMVGFTAEYACFLHMAQRMDIRSAIARAAMDAGSWITALLAAQFMQQGLPVDQSMASELQNLMNAYETMMRTLQQFKMQLQQQSQPQQQNNWMGNQQPQQFQQPINVNVGGAVFNGSGMFTNNPVPSAPANTDIGGLAMLPSMGEFRDENTRERKPSLEEIHFSPNEAPQIVQKVQTPVIPQKGNSTPAKYGHLHSAGHCKGVVRNWSQDRSHAIAYNPKTHAMFLELDHTGARGIEVIKSLDEVGMEYLDHELDCDLQMKAFSDQLSPRRNVDVDWNNVKLAKRTIDVEKMEGDISIPVSGILNTEKIAACSLEQATQIVKMRLNDKKIRLSSSAPIVYVYRQITPFFIDEKDREMMNIFKNDLSKLEDYLEVFSLLEYCIAKLPVDVWYFINNHFTTTINKELKVGMGLSTQIGNFFEDIKDLIKILSQKGDGVLNAFYSTQKNNISNIFRTLKGEALKKYLITIGGNVEDGFDENFIVFLEDYLTVEVPWLSSKLDVAMRENAGVVMESFLPEFYDSCKWIVEKSQEMHLPQRMIVTADNVKISIDEPTIGKGVYVVSRIK